MPFIYENDNIARLDERYNNAAEMMAGIEAGTWFEDHPTHTWCECLGEIIDLKIAWTHIVMLTPLQSGGFVRKSYEMRRNQLREWEHALVLKQKAGKVVEQPFCTVFHGKPGCGKSMMQATWIKVMSASRDILYQEQDIAVLSPFDKYHSRVHNRTRWIILDDLANTPLEYDQSLACAALIQIVNNVPFVAHKADVESKGNTVPSICGVVGTTNNWHMNIPQITVEDNSIRRRVKAFVDIKVRPECDNGYGAVDETLLDKVGLLNIGGNMIRDTITMTINEGIPGDWRPMTVTENGKPLKLIDMDMRTGFYWLEKLYINHVRKQAEHIKRDRNIKFTKCKKCGLVTCSCSRTEPEPEKQLLLEQDIDPEPPDSVPDLIEREEDSSDPMDIDPVPVAAFAPPFPQAPDPTTLEKQSLATWVGKPIVTGLLPGIGQAVVETVFGATAIGDWLPSMYSWAGNRRQVRNVTHEIIDVFRQEEWFQWWYWMPDAFFQTTFANSICSHVLDHNLARKARFWRRMNYVCLFGLTCSLLKAAEWSLSDGSDWASVDWKYTPKLTYVWLGRVSRLIPTFGLYYAPTSWSAILRNMLPSLSFWCGHVYCGWRSLSIRNGALDYMKKRRSFLSDVAKSRVNQASPYVTRTLKAIGLSAVAVTLAGVAAYLVQQYHDSEPAPQVSEEQVTAKNERAKQYAPTHEEKQYQPVNEEKQSLISLSPEAIAARQVPRPNWHEPICNVVKRKGGVKGITHAQLCSKVAKNITTVFVEVSDKETGKKVKKLYCSLFWLKTGWALTVGHGVPKSLEPMFWYLRDSEKDVNMSKRTIERSQFYKINDRHDLALVRLCGYKNKADLTGYIAELPGVLKGTLVGRDASSNLIHDGKLGFVGDVYSDHQMHRRMWGHWQGAETFVGSCGSIYVTRPESGEAPMIQALHIRGDTKENRCLSRSSFRSMISWRSSAEHSR
jgi:hypothetical protein